MKGPVRNPSTYQFNAAAKTLTFLAPIPTFQGQILGVFNLARQAWIYLPQKTGCGGTWSSPVFTLAFNTSTHADNDALQVFYDDGLTSQLVSGTVTATGPLTNSELRAEPVSIDATELPLPTGAATAARQDATNDLVANMESVLPFVSSYTGATQNRLGTTGTGAPTLPSGASGLAGLVQVFYQALLDRLPAALSSGRLLVDANLPTGAATANNQTSTNTALGIANDRLGPADETAPANDTASSALNGRLQRVAQHLSSILTKMPAFGTVGSPSADVATVQGAAAGQPLRITPGVVAENTITFSGAISINTQLMLLNCSNCSAVSIQIPSIGTGGGIVAEWSNNGTNFGGTITAATGNGGTAWGATFTSAGLYAIPRLGKWLQLRMSVAATGGTTSLSIAQLADSPIVNTLTQLNAGSTNIIGSVIQGYSASTIYAAATKTSIFSAASTNAALVKGSAGKVVRFWLTNTTAAHIMVRLYNLAAAPTVGTSTTFTRIAVPPNGYASGGLEGGYLHSTGIAIAITAGLADNDSTAVTAGAIIGELFTI